MSHHLTVSDFSDDDLAVLSDYKAELVNRAAHHDVRSVCTVVNSRYEVPALRVESRHRSMNKSVADERDARDLEILSAFATGKGRQVLIVGDRGVSL